MLGGNAHCVLSVRSCKDLFHAILITLLVLELSGPNKMAMASEKPVAKFTDHTREKTNYPTLVSINLCADQLVFALADRAQILSLSYLAADPRTSAIAHDLDPDILLNHAHAEEIMALQPDLIFAGPSNNPQTLHLLKKMGYKVIILSAIYSLYDIKSQIILIGEAIHQNIRATMLVETFEEALDALRPAKHMPDILLTDYQINGWISGSDTLFGNIAQEMGFNLVASKLKTRGIGQVSLEQMILAEPDILVFGNTWSNPPVLAAQIFAHPVIKHWENLGKIAYLSEPSWICGSHHSLNLAKNLAVLRESFIAQN